MRPIFQLQSFALQVSTQYNWFMCKWHCLMCTVVLANISTMLINIAVCALRPHLQSLLLEEPAVSKHVLDGTLAVQHVQRRSLILLLSLQQQHEQTR
jgi:hypothetical protein